MGNVHNRLTERQTDGLTKGNTDCLKGILAICVLLCHLWGSLVQENASLVSGIAGRGLGVVMMSLGYLAVSMFFFLSGYGLMVQYKKRGETYTKSFLQKRVLPLYLLCVILIVFYWGARTVFGESVSVGDLVRSFFFGGTVISKGWYLQSILVWYLLFYVCFRLVKKENHQLLALLGAFVLYVTICVAMKLEHTWYECAFCLPMGAFWAAKKEKLDGFLAQKRRHIFWTLAATAAFAGSFAVSQFAPLPAAFTLLAKCASSNIFVLAVVLILKYIPIQNYATKFLGKIYLEIYAVHGFVLMLYRSKIIYIANGLAYSLAAIVTTALLAWAVTPVFKKILLIGKKL